MTVRLPPFILGLLLLGAPALAAADAGGLFEGTGIRADRPTHGSGDGYGSGLSVTIPAATELPNPIGRVPTVDLTSDAADIWDRIRRGFGMPDLYTDEVEAQQVAYLSHPAFLRRVFERGRPFLHHIVAELEARGMPTELALLPMVESAFNPRAYSRAHAAGLWQFIPSTGRVYNLEQNAWVDERRDVIASTEAALDYLQTIYEMHGDWQLALASYNWGEGAVGRAIERNRAAGLPEEYAHLRMPNETRLYVPKLQALKNIVARPELFGITLPYVANKSHLVAVDSPAGLDLAAAARFAEMPLSDLVELNPSFKRPVIPEGSRTLVLPSGNAETFRANLALSGDAATRWRSYSVSARDTLPALAKRFGVSAVALAEANGLPTRARLHPGQSILVPDGADVAGVLEAAQVLPDEPKPKPKPKPPKRSKRAKRVAR